MSSYEQFLASKSLVSASVGIAEPPELHSSLFPFQRDVTNWALRRGRAALFEDCGLGKSRQALEWARVVSAHTEKPVLILTPLAVAQQFVREGQAIALPVTHCRERSDQTSGVNVTNYERFERFNPEEFGGVVLDESSILKAHDGKTRNALIGSWSRTPFRLACTATPAPNDHMELGNHAEFLGVMTRAEMLSMFFVHDGGETQKWRLKSHAEQDFWRWVCSWAVCISKPSDLGYSDEGYDLPPLRIHEHVIEADQEIARKAGMLFAYEARTLGEQRAARKGSLDARVARAAELVNASGEQWLVWCDLNSESEALARSIPGAVEVTGSDSAQRKEDAIAAFTGTICSCKFFRKHGDQGKAPKSAKSVSPKSAPPIHGGATPTESISGPTQGARHKREMRHDGSLTQATNPSVTESSPRSNRGVSEILKRNSLSDSDNTESHWMSTGASSKNRAAGAPSVVAVSPRTTHAIPDPEVDSDFTSITVTEQASFEASSVPAATLESANSARAPNCLNEPPCTCEGQPIRVIVSKSSIFGFGVNLQRCHNAAFVGLSHSFEQWYQANRRIWRFGQTSPVDCHVITSSAEGAVVSNLKRKQADAERMVLGMVQHMADITRAELGATTRTADRYAPTRKMTIPKWVGKDSAA